MSIPDLQIVLYEEQSKRRRHSSDSNRKKAHPGNQYSRKFKTSDDRKQLFQEYIEHCEKGLSDDSFVPCDMQTFRQYIKDFPSDFDSNAIQAARRERRRRWEYIGIAGMMGKIPWFRENTYRLNMMNRFGWSEKAEKPEEKKSDEENMQSIFEQVLTDEEQKALKNENNMGNNTAGAQGSQG